MAFLKNMWKSNGKHKKLSEEQNLAKSSPEILIQDDDHSSDLLNEDSSQNIEEGDTVQFKVKYLGSTPVEKETNEKITAEAIRTILRVCKAKGKKLQRVKLQVGLNGIKVTEDRSENNEIMEISIYKISYCSADATNSRVFAFIASDSNETIECHAFLCTKRKLAHAVTLSVARAFSMAYEAWRVLPPKTANERLTGKHQEANNQFGNNYQIKSSQQIIDTRQQLIDFDDILSSEDKRVILPRPNGFKQNNWVSFDEENFSESERWPLQHQNGNNNIDLILN